MPRAHIKCNKAKTYAVPVDFLGKHTYIIIELGPGGLIRLREPSARRWLPYPLSRLYVQACALESQQ